MQYREGCCVVCLKAMSRPLKGHGKMRSVASAMWATPQTRHREIKKTPKSSREKPRRGSKRSHTARIVSVTWEEGKRQSERPERERERVLKFRAQSSRSCAASSTPKRQEKSRRQKGTRKNNGKAIVKTRHTTSELATGTSVTERQRY